MNPTPLQTVPTNQNEQPTAPQRGTAPPGLTVQEVLALIQHRVNEQAGPSQAGRGGSGPAPPPRELPRLNIGRAGPSPGPSQASSAGPTASVGPAELHDWLVQISDSTEGSGSEWLSSVTEGQTSNQTMSAVSEVLTDIAGNPLIWGPRGVGAESEPTPANPSVFSSGGNFHPNGGP